MSVHKDKSPTLRAQEHGHQPICAYRTSGNCGVMKQGDKTGALNCNTDPNQQLTVRRLTPVETERLQGFPDQWTKHGIDENGNEVEISDTQRYRQCGNAVTKTVAFWIGKRIVDQDVRGNDY